jgi:hypothetical protein
MQSISWLNELGLTRWQVILRKWTGHWLGVKHCAGGLDQKVDWALTWCQTLCWGSGRRGQLCTSFAFTSYSSVVQWGEKHLSTYLTMITRSEGTGQALWTYRAPPGLVWGLGESFHWTNITGKKSSMCKGPEKESPWFKSWQWEVSSVRWKPNLRPRIQCEIFVFILSVNGSPGKAPSKGRVR